MNATERLGFEVTSIHFDRRRLAFCVSRDVARLLKDMHIVPNGAEIPAGISNARFVIDTANAHGWFR